MGGRYDDLLGGNGGAHHNLQMRCSLVQCGNGNLLWKKPRCGGGNCGALAINEGKRELPVLIRQGCPFGCGLRKNDFSSDDDCPTTISNDSSDGVPLSRHA